MHVCIKLSSILFKELVNLQIAKPWGQNPLGNLPKKRVEYELHIYYIYMHMVCVYVYVCM